MIDTPLTAMITVDAEWLAGGRVRHARWPGSAPPARWPT